MHLAKPKMQFVVVLLALTFFGAQIHLCADLTSNSSASHICPVCSAAATVVATESPVVAFVSTETSFVARAAPRVVSSPLPYAASPRASPTV
jgi:hypothetical protein